MPSPLASHWLLDAEIAQLNHGSFGACPRVVLEAQTAHRERFEREPSRFILHEALPLLDASRSALAELVGCEGDDLAFVPNATTAANAVLRSYPFREGDEIIVTNHGYKACNNAARFVAERCGARVVVAEVPFPLAGANEVVESVLAVVTDRTRLAILDHVTSPTALVFPVDRLVSELEGRGVATFIDGAHAVGMLDLNLEKIGASWYTSNCHKWLCAPKGTAFLHTRRDRQETTRPTVISHGANTLLPDRSKYLCEFDWTGTSDITGWFCVPECIAFLEGLFPGGLPALQEHNRSLALEARTLLCEALSVAPPCPSQMIGSLVTLPLPPGGEIDDQTWPTPEMTLRDELWRKFGVQVPVFVWPEAPHRFLRVSTHAYNCTEDIERLATALRQLVVAC